MTQSTANIGIISTGSEVISGQIRNRNTEWMSQFFTNQGYRVSHHLSCADESEKILAALNFLHIQCDIIVVTGGLGPTSDDITRDSIAEFANSKLEFSESSWQKLLNKVGRPLDQVSETNKRQCFFPANSKIIPNPNGTADGFLCESPVLTYVLPGPPRENRPMIENGVIQSLRSFFPVDLSKRTSLAWTLLDIPESTLGEIVEPSTQSLGIELSYRAHFPYVELKFEVPTERYAALQPVFIDLKQKLTDFIVHEDKNFNPASIVSKTLKRFQDIQIVDLATDGLLNQKLSKEISDTTLDCSISLLTQIESESTDFEFVKSAYAELTDTKLLILIAPNSANHSVIILVKTEDWSKEASVVVPERMQKRRKELQQEYLVEKSLISIQELLQTQ